MFYSYVECYSVVLGKEDVKNNNASFPSISLFVEIS